MTLQSHTSQCSTSCQVSPSTWSVSQAAKASSSSCSTADRDTRRPWHIHITRTSRDMGTYAMTVKKCWVELCATLVVCSILEQLLWKLRVWAEWINHQRQLLSSSVHWCCRWSRPQQEKGAGQGQEQAAQGRGGGGGQSSGWVGDWWWLVIEGLTWMAPVCPL